LTDLSPALRYLSLGQDAAREEVRTTTATAVYEVARPILQGCHAIPTKLKILLDRALSALQQEEVLMIVSGCGWQLDDYQRGYKLKVRLASLLPSGQFCNQRTPGMTDNGPALHRRNGPNDQPGNFHISFHSLHFSPGQSWAIFMYSYFRSFCAN
jgi:hypothetical protein